ncbi:MAG: efflux RND transporter periplasmic adaptor subunit [Candidatus Sericytochromatia bacterium]
MKKILLNTLFIFFSTFFISVNAFSHGGEDHVHEDELEAKKNIVVSEKNTIEKIIKAENNEYKITLEHEPKEIFQNEPVKFNLSIKEIIEDSFFNNDNKKLKNFSLKIANKEINFSEKENIYTFETQIDNFGINNIILSGITEDNIKLNVEIPINIIKLKTNYIPYTIDFILILVFIILVISIYNSKTNGKQKLAFNSLFFLLILSCIFLVHQSIPTKLKPNKRLSFSNTSGANNEIIVPLKIQKMLNMEIEYPQERELKQNLNIMGVLKNTAKNKAEIIAPFSGYLTLKDLKLGQEIKKDEILGFIIKKVPLKDEVDIKNTELNLKIKEIEINSKIKEIENTLKNLKNEYKRAKNEFENKNKQFDLKIEQEKSNLSLIEKEFKRAEPLYKSGNISLRDFQDTENKLNNKKLEIETLEKEKNYFISSENTKKIKDLELQTLLSEKELIFSNKQLNEVKNSNIKVNDKIEIKAPIEGKITKISTISNSQVEENKILVTIVNNEKMLLQAEVFEGFMEKIKEIKTGTFKTPSYKDLFKIDGEKNKFLSVATDIEEDKRTIHIFFEIDNKEGRFKENMIANIALDINNKQNNKLLSIKKDSVLDELGKKFVYILKDTENFYKKEIKTGLENQAYVEILEGLDKNDKVATNSLYQLRASEK